MSEPAAREWCFYLDDMITFAEKVLSYTDGFNQQNFVDSGLNYDATIRNLELIGEAATHIPDEVCKNNPQIPWRIIIATRNRLIHGYLGIDNDTLMEHYPDGYSRVIATVAESTKNSNMSGWSSNNHVPTFSSPHQSRTSSAHLSALIQLEVSK